MESMGNQDSADTGLLAILHSRPMPFPIPSVMLAKTFVAHSSSVFGRRKDSHHLLKLQKLPINVTVHCVCALLAIG